MNTTTDVRPLDTDFMFRVLFIGRMGTGKKYAVKSILSSLKARHAFDEVVTVDLPFSPEDSERVRETQKRASICLIVNAYMTSWDDTWTTLNLDCTLLIITMWYPFVLPPAFRANVDHVFLFRDNIRKTRSLTYERYASAVFPTFEGFGAALEEHTVRLEGDALVLRMTGEQPPSVHWYSASSLSGSEST